MSIAPRNGPTLPRLVLRGPRLRGRRHLAGPTRILQNWPNRELRRGSRLRGRRHLAGPRRSHLFTLLLGEVAFLAACGSTPPALPVPVDVDRAIPATVRATPPTPAGTPASTGTVTIADFQFAPLSIVVRPGAPVMWTNGGRAIHRVVADSGVFDKGQVAPGASTAQTFAQPGSYPYHCAIHPTMRAVVVVQ